MLNDTIAAVSTPRGKGGVALLRVSGADALKIGEEVFRPKSGRALSEYPSRAAVYGSIYAADANGASVEIDDGVATVYRAPASFTGEDTVEICCHGGLLLTETVLTALLAAGARHAEAGEFTRRAFLNGKMGLSSAEALGDLLEAKSREQILLAHGGMGGRTEAKSRALYEELRHILASIYVCIDYPDEDLADMTPEEILGALERCAASLDALISTYRTGHAVAEGIRTVICGRPNVGKSSLYNRIVGRDAAIVTDVEGTTRDVLTETAPLGRVTLLLCDTAGLHATEDAVERIGITRARAELARAELVLALFDASSEPTEEDLSLCRELEAGEASVIAVLNKCDLAGELPSAYRERFPNTVCLSAATGEGMDALTETVERLFIDGSLDPRSDAVLSNARQHAAALKAGRALAAAVEALRAGYPVDVCCSDVELAMEALAELDGRAISEDLVSEIFSHFCVGK